MVMTLIGIDPGQKGGISSMLSNGDPRSVAIDIMPPTERGIYNLLERFTLFSSNPNDVMCKAILEAQHAFPGMGAKNQWTFAQHYGFLRGILVSLKIPFIEVSPQKWMAYFGLKRLKGEDSTTGKKRILQKAQNLFPNTTVALQTADSLMLCEYLRLTNK